jgi:hypothetical protein
MAPIGFDLVKNFFQVHGVDCDLRERTPRAAWCRAALGQMIDDLKRWPASVDKVKLPNSCAR